VFNTATAFSNTTLKPDSHTKLGVMAQLDEDVTTLSGYEYVVVMKSVHPS
jgi:hypothetical protein